MRLFLHNKNSSAYIIIDEYFKRVCSHDEYKHESNKQIQKVIWLEDGIILLTTNNRDKAGKLLIWLLMISKPDKI